MSGGTAGPRTGCPGRRIQCPAGQFFGGTRSAVTPVNLLFLTVLPFEVPFSRGLVTGNLVRDNFGPGPKLSLGPDGPFFFSIILVRFGKKWSGSYFSVVNRFAQQLLFKHAQCHTGIY